MNKTKKILIGLSVACCATFAFAGCATLDKTVTDLIGKGNSVVIEYDQMNELASSRDTIYDLFNEDLLAEGIHLLPPGDPRRGLEASSTSKVSRDNYSLIGWYQHYSLRVDEENNPLDEDGNICNILVELTDANGNPLTDESGNPLTELVSENGKKQGYIYSDRWDFETGVVTKDMTEETKLDGKTVQKFTLYAAWAPDFTYAFYQNETAKDGSWVKYGSATLPAKADSIAVPTWSNETGKIDHEIVPEFYVPRTSVGGSVTPEKRYSMIGLYADAELKTQYASYAKTATDTEEEIFETSIPHPGSIDVETGTAKDTVLRLYTTWREGRWYRVTTAKNFAENVVASAGEGNFVFLEDIDFTPTKDENGLTQTVPWQANKLEFSGVIYGNGHTVKAIESAQNNYDNDIVGGVFGTIAKAAKIEDLTFEGVNFKIANATTKSSGYYGLLAGRIDTGATLTNVKLSGTIFVGDPYEYGTPAYSNYTIGLVCGNMLDARGEKNAAISGINTESIQVKADSVSIGINPAPPFNNIYGWKVKVSVNENGIVVIEKNEDETVDPN